MTKADWTEEQFVAFEAARETALRAAKERAIYFLDRGDPAGCLVAMVYYSKQPISDEYPEPCINWESGGMQTLLALGKHYLEPVEIWPGFFYVDPTNLRHWVQGFR